ncbi:MAG: Hsp70 family protein [Planctomycetes bacterium]|nr:Hsp70 family protein [Planctomycetota bacterium]
MALWAMDLGTSNTGLAQWDDREGRPLLLELPALCRKPGASDPLEAPRTVASATHVLDHLDWVSRIGTWPLIRRWFFLGRHALIGRQATDLNRLRVYPSFLPGFKPYLSTQPLRPVVRSGRRSYTARDVARLFLRELLAEVKRTTGHRIRDLVLTAPVDSYDMYRAELLQICRGLGVRKVRFLDEPVAAAMGYGLSLNRDRIILVVDFGGGTLHLALIALSAREAQAGSCRVLGKEARPIGGDTVDRWLMTEFCRRLGFRLSEDAQDEVVVSWFRLMLSEIRRVKESVYFNETDSFGLVPPERYRYLEEQLKGAAIDLTVRRSDVVDVLRANGLYRTLGECMDGVLGQAAQHGISIDAIDEVLMVGGSTLLPGIYPLFEERFGRSRVRAWQPFEAVVYGACVYAAESFSQSDFIMHDYALLTHDAETHKPEYTVIVPRGTRFPTPADHWRRKFVPTCSLGEPETLFKLVICEIGTNWGGQSHFAWDATGRLHKFGVGGGGASGGGGAVGATGNGDDGRIIVPLNESNPTLGRLAPPHSPSDRLPRLEIAFGVNSDRWLNATVLDLKTRRHLMKEEPVVRLL